MSFDEARCEFWVNFTSGNAVVTRALGLEFRAVPRSVYACAFVFTTEKASVVVAEARSEHFRDRPEVTRKDGPEKSSAWVWCVVLLLQAGFEDRSVEGKPCDVVLPSGSHTLGSFGRVGLYRGRW